jgi:hypothetical protein
MTLHKISRLAVLLLAALVVTVTCMVPLASGQTITAPNSEFFAYVLTPGANSAPISIPVAHRAILVMGQQNAFGFRGVGQVTLLWVPGSFLEWVGLESPDPAAITSGFSNTPGTHIVFLDFNHEVDIQVNTADSFVVHNSSTASRYGSVTLIW